MSFSRITAPENFEFQNKEQKGVKVNYVAGLDDRPKMTAADLKKMFDNAGGDLMSYLTDFASQINGLISALEDDSPSGAANIGAAPVWGEDTSAGNIQAKLVALKDYIGTLAINAGAGDMLKNVYATQENGKVDTAKNAETLDGVDSTGFAREISGQTAIDSIADGDLFPVHDISSSDTVKQRKISWSTLKSAFQSIFAPATHNHGSITSSGSFSNEPDASYGTCFVAWNPSAKIYVAVPAVGRNALGIMPNHANQSVFTGTETVDGADYIPVYDSSATTQKKATLSTILSGTVKNTSGIRITVGTQPASPAVNDLWFSDATS